MYQEVDILHRHPLKGTEHHLCENVYCQAWADGKSEPARGRHIGGQVLLTQLSNCDRLDLGNNHFIYQLLLTTRRFVLDFPAPLNISAASP